MKNLEGYIQDAFDCAPHALRPLLMLLKCMIDEAWENGCECGYKDAKRDALMIADADGATVKSIIKRLQEGL